MTLWDLIIADPPWPETGGGGRGTGNHYVTPHIDEIPAVVLGSPVWTPARAFWLGLWATKTHLPDALALMSACGVTYVTTWTWIKTAGDGQLTLGMGQYGRHGVEYLLFGKRGTIGRNGDEWQRARADFDEPKGKHSAKPAFPYEQAARIFPGEARLEMFAREPRAGWTVWGNEIDGGTITTPQVMRHAAADVPTRDKVLSGYYDGRSRRVNAADVALQKLLLECHAEATGRRELIITRERRASFRSALLELAPSVVLKAVEGIAFDPWWMGTDRGGQRKPFDIKHCIRHHDRFAARWDEHHNKLSPAANVPAWAEEDMA